MHFYYTIIIFRNFDPISVQFAHANHAREVKSHESLEDPYE